MILDSLELQYHDKGSSRGTKIFQYCTCPAGLEAYNFHSSCKQMQLSFKSVFNKEHKGVICKMTSSSNSSQSTRPVGRVLWEELLEEVILHMYDECYGKNYWRKSYCICRMSAMGRITGPF